MKAFKIHQQGEYEIVAAQNNIKAVIFYIDETGFEIEDFNNDDIIEEIHKNKWIKIRIDSEGVVNKNGDKTLFDLMQIVVENECEMIATSSY